MHLVRCCAQVLPFCSEETLQILERNLGSLPSVTQLLNEGLTAQDIVNRYAAGQLAETFLCLYMLCRLLPVLDPG